MIDTTFTPQYIGYLASPEWLIIRRAKLIEKDFTCERCKRRSFDAHGDLLLDIHHLTYAHFMHEPLTDLQVLCRRCHEIITGRPFNIDELNRRTVANAQQPGRRG